MSVRSKGGGSFDTKVYISHIYMVVARAMMPLHDQLCITTRIFVQPENPNFLKLLRDYVLHVNVRSNISQMFFLPTPNSKSELQNFLQ